MSKLCGYCGTECLDDAQFCISCGAQFADSGNPYAAGQDYGQAQADYQNGQYQQGQADYQNGQYQQGQADYQNGQYQQGQADYQNGQYQQGQADYQNSQYQQGQTDYQNGQYQQGQEYQVQEYEGEPYEGEYDIHPNGLLECYVAFWKNYTNFRGRARRAEYWKFLLMNLLVSFILGLIGNLIPVAKVLTTIYTLAALIPTLSLAARRLHDIGKSGWMYLLVLIPLVGQILVIVWFCTDSQPGDNQYGPNPKGVY